MKALPAIIFSLLITAVVAVSMAVIGTNALLNKDTVTVANAASPAAASDVSNVSMSTNTDLAAAQQQINQMQQLLSQYQSREKQYQAELKQAAQKVNDANAQLSQSSQQLQVYQQVLTELQQRGLIRITQDGQILLRRGGD